MQTKDEQKRIVAARLRRMLNVGDQVLTQSLFWDDIDTLLNLVLENKDE